MKRKKQPPPAHPAQYFMVSPHRDTENFFANAVGMTAHKFSRGKAGITPVFKDDAQRASFYDRAVAERRSLYIPSFFSSAASHRYRAAEHLANASWGGRFGSQGISGAEAGTPLSKRTNRALADFRGVSATQPRVYVQAHGAPGGESSRLQSDTREEARVGDVSRMLSKMKLPPQADVRVNSCWGGAGKNYGRENTDWQSRFRAGSLAEVSDVHNSFAAKLHKELRNSMGFKGWTSGYLASTTQAALTVQKSNGTTGQHMGAVVENANTRNELAVRRKDMRVTFSS
ncbi:hypothetical protein FNU76_22945 [Chitinimonas arctica]|uniref:Uncharacterized protein n=1 Tax=Chitinimonas arctica TaxID=2594795 RepID=A0A516SLE3_9NEIS|nr:hypothetical protein [Chitinimonas arctica]QDQ28972.1 hypothetical protein FNU76_22945 [Chitinimonas arctica]